MSNAPLAQSMRALAERMPEHAEELRAKADAMEAAINGDITNGNYSKNVLGAWARARSLYCRITGEPLI